MNGATNQVSSCPTRRRNELLGLSVVTACGLDCCYVVIDRIFLAMFLVTFKDSHAGSVINKPEGRVHARITS